MPYLFKDTDLAAYRLRVLADVFAVSSRTFLQDVVTTTPQLAVDLGCGPGYTTHLLADTTHCVRAIGLDNSEHFLTLASRSATERISFVRHDVTQIPFPTGQSDLISCRMLLTHLQDPLSVIECWGTQLRPHGLLLLEEVEWIQTELSLFRSYLDIVAAMLKQQANQLYIGPLLDKHQMGNELRRCISRVYHLPVSTAQAATMFYLNIQSWKNQPFIQKHYSATIIDQMEHDLQELTATSTSESEIEWGMRQIAYERV
ncbi:MAG: class I SAM-dependent methyltransferase [Chloroflexi bacterium]|nr:class I SAM-dependent methyltransferase [Chloroflexota bacterium]